MLIDSNSGKPTRVGYKFLENGTKQRIAKASGKADLQKVIDGFNEKLEAVRERKEGEIMTV
jgi:ribosome recycling factor